MISVDTKKKELVGEYKNDGREWRPKDGAIAVNGHDFPDPKVPKAIPYGIYDIGGNSGWVNVGVTADTAEFAVSSINWRGKPLTSYKVIVSLIASTTTTAGLTVKARLDRKVYAKGKKVPDHEMKNLKLFKSEFHGDWNYTIKPARP